MASLKLSLFEEHQGDGQRASKAVVIDSRIMGLDNGRCRVAEFLKKALGKNAKMTVNKDSIELRSRKPLKKVGSVLVWGKAIVSLNDGAAYELTIMADVLSDTLTAVD